HTGRGPLRPARPRRLRLRRSRRRAVAQGAVRVARRVARASVLAAGVLLRRRPHVDPELADGLQPRLTRATRLQRDVRFDRDERLGAGRSRALLPPRAVRDREAPDPADADPVASEAREEADVGVESQSPLDDDGLEGEVAMLLGA